MDNIIDGPYAIDIAQQLKANNTSIVLVGGCFDLLHAGHIAFLEAAKKQGDSLFVLLESDESIQQKKGVKRPLNTQKERAYILSAIRFVDYVILLPFFSANEQYDNLISAIKPDIIATTKGDPGRTHKERAANLSGAKVVDVIDRLSGFSTSKLIKEHL